MPTAPDLSDLIARLEKATGPDRELDQRIYCAVHEGFDVIEGVVVAIMGGFRATVRDDLVPRYTGSIDAALTLVSERCDWDVGMYREIGGGRALVIRDTPPNGAIFIHGKHAMPAIALCIAALKARMQGGDR